MLTATFAWGTIPGWLTVAALLIGGSWLSRSLARGKAGEALETLERANRVLSDELGRVRAENVSLRATHTLEPVLAAIAEHEKREAQAWEKVLGILDLIAARLGPDVTADA